MSPNLPQAAWVDRCAMVLGRLRPDADPLACAEVAADLWYDASDLDPAEAASLEASTWPQVGPATG